MTGGRDAPPRSFADEAFATTAEAFARAAGDWELAIQSAIAALFEFLASRPEQTKACIVDDCGAGPAALARRDRTIDHFTELLLPLFATTSTPPPPVVAEAIGGGIYELVRGHVLERRLEDLPAAIPDATTVALSPFAPADRV